MKVGEKERESCFEPFFRNQGLSNHSNLNSAIPSTWPGKESVALGRDSLYVHLQLNHHNYWLVGFHSLKKKMSQWVLSSPSVTVEICQYLKPKGINR